LFCVNLTQQTVGAADVGACGDGKFQKPTGFLRVSGIIECLRPLLQRTNKKRIILVVGCEQINIGSAIAEFQFCVADSSEIDDGDLA
jgi:hypothetical protein